MDGVCSVCGLDLDAVGRRFCSPRCEALSPWTLPSTASCCSEPSPLEDIFPTGAPSFDEVVAALCSAQHHPTQQGDATRTPLATLLFEELRNQVYHRTHGAVYVRHLNDVGEDVAVCGAPSVSPGALLLPRAETCLGTLLSCPPDDPARCLEAAGRLSEEESFLVAELLPRAVLHASQWAACAVPFLQSSSMNVALSSKCVMWKLMAKRSVLKPMGCKSAGGVFTTLSFVSHSCSPNCVIASVEDTVSESDVVKGQLVALRPMKRGEQLTTSVRLTSVELRMSTGVRQEILQLSRGVTPHCACTRCSAAVDYSRGFVCECGGIRYPDNNSLPQQTTVWRCTQCGEWWGEHEMPIAEENRICETVYRLWMSLCREEIDGNAPPPSLSKNTFADIRDITVKASSVLGEGHWTSLVLAEVSIGFYRCFLKRFSALTADEAQSMIAKWALRWIQLALLQRFDEYCPIETGVQTLRCASLLSSPTLFSEKVRLLRFAHRHLEPLLVAANASNGDRVQFPLCQEASVLWDVMRSSKIANDWKEVCKWVNKDMETANDLLEEWENYLVSRVAAVRPQRPSADAQESDAIVNPFLEKALRNGTR